MGGRETAEMATAEDLPTFEERLRRLGAGGARLDYYREWNGEGRAFLLLTDAAGETVGWQVARNVLRPVDPIVLREILREMLV